MTHNDRTEEEIIRLVRDGDAPAMKQLYSCYIGFLTGLCSRYVNDDDDVCDILQESFIKIFTSINQFSYRGEGSVKAWMSRIVVNESIRFIKKNERFDKQPIDEVLSTDIIEEDVPAIDDIPLDEIQRMIKNLPVGYRTVFNLYVFEEKSHKEIALILGIKESSSASQLHRAKDMLAKWITEYRCTHDKL